MTELGNEIINLQAIDVQTMGHYRSYIQTNQPVNILTVWSVKYL